MTSAIGTVFKTAYKKKPQAFTGLLIFLVCVWIYLANDTNLSSHDTVPNTLLAFNWLENNSFHFDAYRESLPRHFLTVAPNGHITSAYPIGVAIISFPLYWIFFVGIKLFNLIQLHLFDNPGITISIIDANFDPYRQLFEKLAGTILTAFSVVLFYLMVRLKFEQAIALLTTFIFAFATSIWSTSSQGLWQHTGNTVLLTGAMLCLLKANRTSGTRQKILLTAAGFCSGLLPGTRTTSLLYGVVLLLYAIAIYRRTAIYFLFGFCSILFNIAWNIYYFGFDWKGLLVGGYSRYDTAEGTFMERFYRWTVPQFIEGSLGMLVSPSVGLFVFSPITLFAIPGIRRTLLGRFQKDELLLSALAIASVGIFLQYCFYTVWSGGGSYGPRYLTDVMPVLCYFIAYFVAQVVQKPISTLFQRKHLLYLLFWVALLYSIYIQLIAVFGTTFWYYAPYRIPLYSQTPTITEGRLWQIRDNTIERHTRNLYNRLFPPVPDASQYLGQLTGQILSIEDLETEGSPFVWQAAKREFKVLRAVVKNTGEIGWYGYETGMTHTIASIQIRLVSTDTKNTPQRIFPLFVSGNTAPGETAIALGQVRVPQEPGNFQLIFELSAYKVGTFPQQIPTILDLKVEPQTPGTEKQGPSGASS